MNDITTVETEEQQRGQAFLRALEQLKREYNCTMTITPKWVSGVSRTWVLGFDEQVMVGPAPPMPEILGPPDNDGKKDDG